jgi:hypothetical protein
MDLSLDSSLYFTRLCSDLRSTSQVFEGHRKVWYFVVGHGDVVACRGDLGF